MSNRFKIEAYDQEKHKDIDVLNFDCSREIFNAKLNTSINSNKSIYLILSKDTTNKKPMGFIKIQTSALVKQKTIEENEFEFGKKIYTYEPAIELVSFALDNDYRGIKHESEEQKKISKLFDNEESKAELEILKEINLNEYNRVIRLLTNDYNLSDIIFHNFINEILLKKLKKIINFEYLVLHAVDIDHVIQIYEDYGFYKTKEENIIINTNSKIENCIFMKKKI